MNIAGKLSIHVLDTARGKPAAGVVVKLFRDNALLVTAITNTDGRLDAPLLVGDSFIAGAYRLEFSVGDYFDSIQHADARKFLDRVPIEFVVTDASADYHVPLLVSPWAYSTYRGS